MLRDLTRKLLVLAYEEMRLGCRKPLELTFQTLPAWEDTIKRDLRGTSKVISRGKAKDLCLASFSFWGAVGDGKPYGNSLALGFMSEVGDYLMILTFQAPNTWEDAHM